MSYRVITGKLIARSAPHIGSGEGGEVTDDLCRRTADGEFILPGTAIGGALRTLATRIAPRLGGSPCRELYSEDERKTWNERQRDEPCPCWACHLFGHVNPSEGNDEETGGCASRLLIAHAKLLSIPKPVKIRDGVGIDRASRASARAGSVKFDLEALPAETAFELRMELTGADENDERLLAAVLAEWQAGRAWLGGRVARGLGAFRLDGIRMLKLDVAQPEDLLKYLTADEPWKQATEETGWLGNYLNKIQARSGTAYPDGVARSFVSVNLTLKFDGLFLSNDTMAAGWSGFDHAPLLDVLSKQGRLILPGASLRGVLRAHAERIARTLATLDANNKEEFLAICPACNPVESNDERPLANCDTLLTKAGVGGDEEVNERQLCLACRLFGSTRRGSRFIVEDATGTGEFGSGSKVLDFLAIDRFTGGGKDGAKFDAVASNKPSFDVRLHLENPEEWELGWLALVLRDLQDGMLTVGFGAAKGFGQAKIESYQFDYGFIGDSDFCGPGDLIQPRSGDCASLYRQLSWDTSILDQQIKLRQLQQRWLNEFHKERRQFKRIELEKAKELRLNKKEGWLPYLKDGKDTFFDEGVAQLYGEARAN